MIFFNDNNKGLCWTTVPQLAGPFPVLPECHGQHLYWQMDRQRKSGNLSVLDSVLHHQWHYHPAKQFRSPTGPCVAKEPVMSNVEHFR